MIKLVKWDFSQKVVSKKQAKISSEVQEERERESKEEKMGLDYYKILHVDKKASIDDLYKAFSKLYTKMDPEKHPNNRKEVVIKLKLVCKACEVLTDPQKRAVYDQYGEEGLKTRVQPPGSGGPGGSTTYFSTGGGPTTYRLNPRSKEDIFAECFGSPGGGSPGGSIPGFSSAFRSNPGYSDGDPFGNVFGFASPSSGTVDGGCGMRANSSLQGMFGGNLFSSFGGGGGSSPGVSMHQTSLKKASPIEKNLACSLEELYKGTDKKMKISREVTDANTGNKMTVEEIVTVNVKPGWKKGTKITFPRKGNEVPGVEPADVVFIIDEKPHKLLTREGNDLIVTQKVSQAEASSGYEVHLVTLDGRKLTIPINYVIRPTSEVVVLGEGMPLPKDPSKKGNLRVRFDVKN